MSDREVVNCGLRQVFACEKYWSDLEPTADPNRAFCGECQCSVFRVHSVVDARIRAESGECIAVPPAIAAVAKEVHAPGRLIVGRWDWNRVFPG